MKIVTHPSTDDVMYKRRQKAKYNGWNIYFEGDGIAFGDIGRYYKWIVPFVLKGHRCSNFDFQEVEIEEFIKNKDKQFGFWKRLYWDIWRNI